MKGRDHGLDYSALKRVLGCFFLFLESCEFKFISGKDFRQRFVFLRVSVVLV